MGLNFIKGKFTLEVDPSLKKIPCDYCDFSNIFTESKKGLLVRSLDVLDRFDQWKRNIKAFYGLYQENKKDPEIESLIQDVLSRLTTEGDLVYREGQREEIFNKYLEEVLRQPFDQLSKLQKYYARALDDKEVSNSGKHAHLPSL